MIPRIRFAHLPTAVETLPRLSAHLGGPEILIKRDDQTGLAFGGNKTRKLEFLFAEAQADGARTVITAGSGQSNHCRQTAAAAARFGFDCILVLGGKPPPLASSNLLLDKIFDCELVWTYGKDRDAIFQETFTKAWEAGRRPYKIPYGGSNSTGAVAYAYAIKELMDQEFNPEWIVFATSSGGTQAGLVAGAKLFNCQGSILGISVDEPANKLKRFVAQLAGKVTDRLGQVIKFSADDIFVNDDYLGGGYGIMGEPELEAIQLFARKEGILLDPVYTGRAAAGMVDLIHKGFFSTGDRVLFWHTGGTPGLFADKYRDYFG